MYVIEGPEHGFTSIPKGIYWAIVTLTTVGFGDIVPKTPLGQVVSSLVMITGYSIIAVPTGIFTAELANAMRGDTCSTLPGVRKNSHEPARRSALVAAMHCSKTGISKALFNL
jgi:voltage-gated potassium channel